MFTKEEYFSYYFEKGKTVDQIDIPNNKLNERQLERKYQNYVKKNSKKFFVNDEEWEKLVQLVRWRDGSCKFIKTLSKTEREILKEKSNGAWKTEDPAHVFGKGSFPFLKYDPENVYLINRWSHSCLDNCLHPIYGTQISREERDNFWKKIIGESIFKKLKEKSIEGRR